MDVVYFFLQSEDSHEAKEKIETHSDMPEFVLNASGSTKTDSRVSGIEKSQKWNFRLF